MTVLLALGVPPRTVMDIVGHTTLETTMNVYEHVTLDDKRQVIDRFGELLGDSDSDGDDSRDDAGESEESEWGRCCHHPLLSTAIMTGPRTVFSLVGVVARDGVEPPTFRFSVAYQSSG